MGLYSRHSSRGGKNGGGVPLPPTGKELLALFPRVQQKLEQFSTEESGQWLQQKH